ncbi:MAG: TetR/AcrR family transcriptional regulator C-terminal domain-containing protein [Actinobacteria bacterium]|nr:TetR/AcrR family transcriptional regulator C-terminal domain-containing protein [Actinomycetota bacterium]
MGRPAALSRERIISAAVVLAARAGVDQLTVRALGDELGCDPTALYRHFRNMEELHRAVGDHFLADVDVAPRPRESWRTAVRRLCRELRQAQLRQPRLAVFVRSAPTRLQNEVAITEALLRELAKGGFRAPAAARAYHALIEFTVGSATIDAALASQPVATREATYRTWRSDYAALPADEFPAIAAVASHLYQGSADRRFDDALDALLAGLESRRR